jgi:hypothetical protein
MNTRFFAGALIFAIACLLQFLFTPAGVTINFIFAVLIAFSFIFSAEKGGFWELLFFVCVGIFLMNWLPVPSVAIAVFAAIPMLAYFFRAVFPWEAWAGVVLSLLSGFIILYLTTAPRFIIIATPSFLLDLFMGSAFGLIIFLCMDRAFEINS